MAGGLLVRGNIDLANRPKVANPAGGTSTVYSMSFWDPRYGEVLVPLADEGRILSEDEARAKFYKTGKHLGIFSNPTDATRFAEALHNDYAAGHYDQTVTAPLSVSLGALATRRK